MDIYGMVLHWNYNAADVICLWEKYGYNRLAGICDMFYSNDSADWLYLSYRESSEENLRQEW